MSKHTPGPWTFVHEGGIDGGYFIDAKEDVVVLPRGRLNEADARLIAAAPDMLVALQDALLHGNLPGWIAKRVGAAIAKAEGTS